MTAQGIRGPHLQLPLAILHKFTISIMGSDIPPQENKISASSVHICSRK